MGLTRKVNEELEKHLFEHAAAGQKFPRPPRQESGSEGPEGLK